MVCGKLEIDILNSFWNLENDDADISIQDVVDDLSRQGIKRAYTTIKTVMDRLVAKSVLVRYKSGKKFFYKAVMSRTETIAESVNTLLEQFFGGDCSELLRFVETECKLLV
ncbi:MAG: BlaI/MecI/CopY family transcriptional regulator [Heliobacteriaceae bacterium]|jgi:predicted transcriptional regulator|nr:BlaI/MecI/CopY family transcriptional regulator [Heliobacteriaceae bacterium]